MCRSVPHMEATFTFTSTSLGPISGRGTWRNSDPGAGCGFTMACMVSGMHNNPFQEHRDGTKVRGQTLESITRIPAARVEEPRSKKELGRERPPEPEP